MDVPLDFIPQRILITGFSGFVGSHLVEGCRKRYPGAHLFGLSTGSTRRPPLPDMSDITPLAIDITDPEQVNSVIAEAQPDLIFHLAAQSSVATSWADPAATLRINALGTVYLLEALRAAHLSPRVLLVGSGEQYGLIRPEDNPITEEQAFRPVTPYGVSKATQDLYGYQYYAAYDLPILRVRPFNSFGPRQTDAFVIAGFARQIALIEARQAEPVLFVGNLQARRDFLPIEDVVQAYLAIAQRGQPGDAYNVGSGQARSIREILDLLLSYAKRAIQVREDPARMRPIDVPLAVADIFRLRATTGWKPMVNFESALRQTLDYWREIIIPARSR
jgi:GDP-4-dehydro-6-deoxy-D-mannose reductase